MFEFVAKHQFGAAAAIYWIFSAAVSAMPEPDAQNHPGYLWLYRFAHTIAGNITTVFGSRIPGLKVLGLLLAASLVLPAQACVAHYTVHPGALNQTDSASYDALLIAETVIDQAKAASPGPPDATLKALIDSYNVARQSWLTYRGAITTNVPQQVYLDNLNKNLVDLTNAIRELRESAANASPTGRSNQVKGGVQ
jgi:hypothetical protein